MTEKEKLNTVENKVHSNVFQIWDFDNFLVNFNVQEICVPQSIILRPVGNDMWRVGE